MDPRIGTIGIFKITPDIVRPAMVVDVLPSNKLQLQVFVDGLNDRGLPTGPNEIECARGMMWRMSVERGDGVGQCTTEQPKPENITGEPDMTDVPDDVFDEQEPPPVAETALGDPGGGGLAAEPEPETLSEGRGEEPPARV